MMISASWRRIPDHLQHSILAACWMAVVGLPWWALGLDLPAVVGALFGVVVFYGREQRDAEIHNAGLLDRPQMDSWRSLIPPLWRYRDAEIDLYWPLVTNALLAAAIETGRAALA